MRSAGFACAVSVAGLLAVVPPAGAAVSCDYDGGFDILDVSVSADGDWAMMSLGSGTPAPIVVKNQSGPSVSCDSGDGDPTVANVAEVNVNDVSANGSTTLHVTNPAGFAPGPIGEVEGNAEIEFYVDLAGGSSDQLALVAPASGPPASWVLGTGGMNWNAVGGDTDRDLRPPNNTGGVAQMGIEKWTLAGASGNDVISAQGDSGSDGPGAAFAPGAGTDLTISGSDGNDELSGGDGAVGDTLLGGSGNDVVSGFAGEDGLAGDAGDDTLAGGAGDADLTGYGFYPAGVTVDLGTTAAQDIGGGEIETISGIENVNGSGAADTLLGNGSANVLKGSSGDDTLVGRGGPDTLDGAAGSDTVSFAGSPAGVTANLATGTASGGEGADVLSAIENLTGSPFADDLTGSSAGNVVDPLGGADIVAALAGPDSVDVRDGVPDTASCGSETDSATADRRGVDTVNADCENVAFLPDSPDGGGADPGDELTRDLTLRYRERNRRFTGALRSNDSACEIARVKVFEKQRGKDSRVGGDRTNEAGRWSLREEKPHGAYYAKVKEKQVAAGICPAAKSSTRRVR